MPSPFTGTSNKVKQRFRHFFIGDGISCIGINMEVAIKRGTDCTSTDGLVALNFQCGLRYEPLSRTPFIDRCAANAAQQRVSRVCLLPV
jgi:hypothetical protein